jgi:hypothetical protein
MADSYTTPVTTPDDVEVGAQVKVVPKGMPGMPGMRLDAKMGKVVSKAPGSIKVDLQGMPMDISIPAKKKDMFKWDVFKKVAGGRRRRTSKKKATRRKTQRRR